MFAVNRIYLIALMIVSLLLAAAGAAAAQDNPVTVAFSDPSRPGTVRVNVMSGGLTVKTHAGRDVIIQTRAGRVTSRSRAQREAENQGLRRLEAVSSGLSVDEENNIMNIGTTRMNSSDLEIQLPARTNLKVGMVNGENVVIEGVDGEIEITNNNGNITLTDVSGSVVAHSSNGNLNATLRRVTPQKPMSFTSINGRVDVTLPADTKANLKLRADNGDVWTDFDVQLKPASPPVVEDSRSRSGGRMVIRVDKSILGTINGGGPDFELRSFNGNVYIRKLK
jgi:hypothetical protein